jgi:hypothetical protein
MQATILLWMTFTTVSFLLRDAYLFCLVGTSFDPVGETNTSGIRSGEWITIMETLLIAAIYLLGVLTGQLITGIALLWGKKKP